MTNALSKLDLTSLIGTASAWAEQVTLHHIYILLGGVFAAYFLKWLAQYLNVRWVSLSLSLVLVVG